MRLKRDLMRIAMAGEEYRKTRAMMPRKPNLKTRIRISAATEKSGVRKRIIKGLELPNPFKPEGEDAG
jgi:hypothetical protein